MMTTGWVNAEGLAKHFGISIPTVRRMTQSGRIPSHKVGKRLIRYNIHDVEVAFREDRTPEVERLDAPY